MEEMSTHKRYLILVVDDEIRISRMIRMNLEHDGYDVIEANSGQQALDMVRSRMPNLVIMTLDLALRNIVRLGDCALETLTALSLRSVGCDKDKRASMGNVGGTLFVRASKAAADTYDAMRCRGFEGSYDRKGRPRLHVADIAWAVVFALFAALFLHLEGIL